MKSKMQTCSCRILDFSAILVLKVTLSNRMQKLLFYPRFGYDFPVFYSLIHSFSVKASSLIRKRKDKAVWLPIQ